MCLIAFAWRVHPRWPLVLVANRDEFHARASAPADFLADAPDVFGGIDLRAGGSWLLASKRRRLAAITNVRVGLSADAAPRSRGELVKAFAASDAGAAEFIAGIAPHAHEYGRFNLLLWDGQSLHCVGNHPRFRSEEVAPGLHALSNAELDTDWPKARRAKQAVSDWLHLQVNAAPEPDTPPDTKALFDALADTRQAPDPEPPDTGVGLEIERRLSPPFVMGDTYGTRCSTIVLASYDGIEMTERRFGANQARESEKEDPIMRNLKTWLLLFLLLIGTTAMAQATAPTAPAANGSPIARDFPPGLQIPDAARPGPHFDADKATEAYLNLLSPEQRKLSDAYFEGGYWLQLWGFLLGIVVGIFLLASGISVRMRDVAQRLVRWRWLSTAIYALMWLVVGFLLGLPWDYYTGFVREHQYGLSNQDVSAWLSDEGKGLMIAAILLPLLISLLYAAIRKLGARWWIWASIGSFVLSLALEMAAPVFLAPVFNDYHPLPAGNVREAVLSLARANRIPTENVEWFDASKQTTRVSANVSGFLNTTQVSLNDNLVNRTSLPEIRAVLGHEMGHYVLNHSLRLTIYSSLVVALGFFFVHRLLDWSLARWGGRLKLEGRDDPAALPLAVIAFSIFMFLATPVNNMIVHQAEAEADAFGLNAAREPNGFAMSAMRLSTYRKLRPGPIEEAIFYDHPSGYTRVHNSMLWLAENQDNPTANAPVAPPMQPLKFDSKLNEPPKGH